MYDDTLQSVTFLNAPLFEVGDSVWGAELTDGTLVAIWTLATFGDPQGTPAPVRGQVYVEIGPPGRPACTRRAGVAICLTGTGP